MPKRLPAKTAQRSPVSVEAQPKKKQGTRMLKVVCTNGTGYTVRMTRMWIDTHGTPSCPCCGLPMVED